KRQRNPQVAEGATQADGGWLSAAGVSLNIPEGAYPGLEFFQLGGEFINSSAGGIPIRVFAMQHDKPVLFLTNRLNIPKVAHPLDVINQGAGSLLVITAQQLDGVAGGRPGHQ